MAGFGIPMGQPPGPPPAAPAAPMAGAMPAGAPQPAPNAPQGDQASPEEQELYNRFVARAMQHIYDERTFPGIVEDMKAMQDVPLDLGTLSATVAFAVMQKAKQAGQKIPGDVLLHGGAEIVQQMVEVYDRATNAKLPPEESEAVLYHAADKFRELAGSSGDIDAQEVAAAMQDLGPGGDLEAMLGAQDTPAAPPAAPPASGLGAGPQPGMAVR